MNKDTYGVAVSQTAHPKDFIHEFQLQTLRYRPLVVGREHKSLYPMTGQSIAATLRDYDAHIAHIQRDGRMATPDHTGFNPTIQNVVQNLSNIFRYDSLGTRRVVPKIYRT
jgi:hypothetical protein